MAVTVCSKERGREMKKGGREEEGEEAESEEEKSEQRGQRKMGGVK
jgi:hypothetical protein